MSKYNPKYQPENHTHWLTLGRHVMAVDNPQSHPLLLDFWRDHCLESCPDQEPALGLSVTDLGLNCRWKNPSGSPVNLNIDVEKFVSRQTSFPAKRGGIINQALGNKTRTVADMTGGWGGDALLLACQGYQVSIYERNPLMALFLRDAMQRFAESAWVQSQGVFVPSVIEVDASEWLKSSEVSEIQAIDCLYLDPMFPPKRKRSAAPNKEMQFLQWFLGPQDDAKILLTDAMSSGVPRIVVKRPKHAEPLLANPADRFSGKLVHYDVYLNHV